MCHHEHVLVDYLHPHQTLVGIRVIDLQASGPTQTRPIMGLDKPRCADCGQPLARTVLKKRARSGGDLYDPRFVWCNLKSV